MKQVEPRLTKAGSRSVLLGFSAEPPLVDCRVVAEDYWQEHHIGRIEQLEQQLDRIILKADKMRCTKNALINELKRQLKHKAGVK